MVCMVGCDGAWWGAVVLAVVLVEVAVAEVGFGAVQWWGSSRQLTISFFDFMPSDIPFTFFTGSGGGVGSLLPYGDELPPPPP